MYCHELYSAKTRFFGLHFVRCLSLSISTLLAAKATEFSRTKQYGGHYAVHGHRFRYQSKAHMRLPINDCLMPTYIVSLTVSKFHVIADNWSTVVWPTSLQHTRSRWTPKHKTAAKSDLSKPETSLYCVLQNVFRYLVSFRQGSRVWLTDRRTDR